MVESLYTHVTLPVDDVDEAADFYTEVFGLEEIPSVKFDTPVRWMKVGDIQLHLLQVEVPSPEFHHMALHVDNFEAFYQAAMAYEGAMFEPLPNTEFKDDQPPVAYLPNGTIQCYIRDPSGNLIEVNYPDVGDIDPTIVGNLVDRPDVAPDTPSEAGIYGEYGLDPRWQ